MAVITVGPVPNSHGLGTTAGNTCIDVTVPADGTGIINQVQLYIDTGGTFEVAIFYADGGVGKYSTRSTASLGVLGTGLQTKAVNMAVVLGDFIGFYTAGGKVCFGISDQARITAGDQIPCTQVSFGAQGVDLSIRGTGVTSVTPAITSITLDHGAVGDTVTIAGTDFKTPQGTGSVTFAGGGAAAITSWADAQIVCVVPAGTITGNVTVTNSDANSDTIAWTLDPDVDTVTPNSGAVGDSVTIDGSAFEAAQGTGSVTVNGTPATIVSWSDTEIVIVIPVGATSGDIVVTTDSGYTSPGVPFTVTVPASGGAIGANLGGGPIFAGASVCNPPVIG